ncbi:hypothetical protein BS78_07G125500 [Paspalum vaginatum]|nr:hypothetical protein BS78_07G125500 [Paspalum vaginatum]
MIGHIETLDRLGIEFDPELATDVILQSLPLSFMLFIMNYHMNSLDKALTELYGMLKTTVDSIKKTSNHVMMVQRDSKKRKRKGKGKAEDRIQKSKPDAKPMVGPSPSDKCFYCGDSGTWKRRKRREVRLPLQGLKQTRSFAKGELDVRVGNGAKH